MDPDNWDRALPSGRLAIGEGVVFVRTQLVEERQLLLASFGNTMRTQLFAGGGVEYVLVLLGIRVPGIGLIHVRPSLHGSHNA